MTVFRDITISWNGQDYTVTPTMRLLRQIESEGVSLIHMAHQVSVGKPQASIMALVVARVMQSAGAAVTEEQLYQEFVVGDAKAAMQLYEQIVLSITPGGSDEKKPDAPDE